ncbi:DUF4276 family protein [candidate division WOR-3 bacterium]|nr:DUF4276 family protein [candidate division WOR-3 bacterium]
MRIDYIMLVIEGNLDNVVSKKLISTYASKIDIRRVIQLGGRSEIQKRINKYNQAAHILPFLVLVDLDTDECPPILINDWLPQRNPHLLLRIAVRQVEAWLLADREAIADFLNVGLNRIPVQSETIDKTPELIMVVARKSRKKIIRESIPPSGETAKRGRDYNGQLSRFVMEQWNPERARKNSPSLDKTILALQKL